MITLGMELEYRAPQRHRHGRARTLANGIQIQSGWCDEDWCMPPATARLRRKVYPIQTQQPRGNPRWQVVEDGSISGYNRGAELRTPWGAIQDWRDRYFPDLAWLLQRLREEGWEAHRSCGWHVHVGVTGGWRAQPRLLVPVIQTLLPWLEAIEMEDPAWESRANYCRWWGPGEQIAVGRWMEDIQEGGRFPIAMPIHDRYRALNLWSLQYHNTLEIRRWNSRLDLDTMWDRLHSLAELLTDAVAEAEQPVITH